MKQKLLFLILLLTLFGIIDSAYLTKAHISNFIPPCSTGLFADCGKVLQSQYAVVFGIPLALVGVAHYFFLALLTILNIKTGKKIFIYLLIIQSTVGAVVSIYLMYLQFFVIGSICLYCTLSAAISFLILGIIQIFFQKEKKELRIFITGFLYRSFVKPILFLIDAELVHEKMLNFGQILGRFPIATKTISHLIEYNHPCLRQKIAGIKFEHPIGLAAGFDYQAKLTQILPSLGFGFTTVGTITNLPYEGNPKPRLDRLPRSKSLLVNKGFKNEGADRIIRLLTSKSFAIPIGISIGRTNSPLLPTLKKSIQDIIDAFGKFENSRVKHSYYELNISCPNLIYSNEITFYPPKNLEQLLSEVQKLRIKKPIFIKMPIEKSNREILKMFEVISKYNIAGVIIGNLQKNRHDPSLDPKEVTKCKKGNFSGKPTWRRSNELIKLAYRYFAKRLIIIGCGGVFSAEDAYSKIKLGASLIQLITGIVYQGPQLISQINIGLAELLQKDGFKNIKEAIGSGI